MTLDDVVQVRVICRISLTYFRLRAALLPQKRPPCSMYAPIHGCLHPPPLLCFANPHPYLELCISNDGSDTKGFGEIEFILVHFRLGSGGAQVVYSINHSTIPSRHQARILIYHFRLESCTHPFPMRATHVSNKGFVHTTSPPNPVRCFPPWNLLFFRHFFPQRNPTLEDIPRPTTLLYGTTVVPLQV